MTGPRLFGIAATSAAVVAVIRRGPTGWCAVGRWDLDTLTYDAGTWLRGTVYPQRCDLSPDGRWITAFILKPSADWPAGSTYVSVSRLPWLTALAAWGTCGTWTRGLHFVEDPASWPSTAPDVGNATPCRDRYGLAWTRASSFAVERRRGWTEAVGTPPRHPDDAWDVRRQVTMEKSCPAGGVTLRASGYYAAFREFGPGHFGESAYWLVPGDGKGEGRVALPDVQWAEWSADGRLLVATVEGRLQVRDADGQTVRWEHDLAVERPRRTPPPAAAQAW